jgi:hypothetical protein
MKESSTLPGLVENCALASGLHWFSNHSEVAMIPVVVRVVELRRRVWPSSRRSRIRREPATEDIDAEKLLTVSAVKDG